MRLPRFLAAYVSNGYQPLDPAPELPLSGINAVKKRRMSASATHRLRLRAHSIAAVAFLPVAAITACFIIYHFVFRFALVDEFVYGFPDVPDYDEYVAWEDRLPQHNVSLEFPEGLNGRYLMFSNQVWGYGLNNQLQEILLLSHLAYLSNRAYVFQPYTWDAKTQANAVLDGKTWRSARIPLTVFISGPTAGGAFAGGDTSPRAVNVRWWETVCPLPRRKVLDVEVEHAKWGVTAETEGKELVERWSQRLTELTDVCVEVTGDTIFDFALIASPRFLSIWSSLSRSSILTRFTWSHLVTAAVQRNLPRFFDPAPSLQDNAPPRLPDEPAPPRPPPPPPIPIQSDDGSPLPSKPWRRKVPAQNVPARNRRPPSPVPVTSSFNLQSSSHDIASQSSNTSQIIKGLVAVHLRRGDFKVHCHWLADRSEPFAGWNQFPYLLDRFTPPPPVTSELDVLGRGRKHAAYMERCWPEIEAIVSRLKEIRRLHPDLERVFVLTNGKKDWVDSLKRALTAKLDGDDGDESQKDSPAPIKIPGAIRVQPVPPPTSDTRPWTEVLTSKDLSLMWTEREVDQAVDMEIARRAEVFLGNGFSSLTSNIVMLRLSDGTPIENNRFW